MKIEGRQRFITGMRNVMATLRRMTLGTLIWILAFSAASAEPVSEFVRLCQASLTRSEAFVSQCNQSARPFRRTFLPSGRNKGTPEEHAVFFDTSDGESHFGLGCVLGPKKEMHFLGLYFALNSVSLKLANSLPITFVDFQGNVGLRSPDGATIVLLAVHQLTPPGRDRNSRHQNCDIGKFDAASNETIVPSGVGYKMFRVAEERPVTITSCVDHEVRFEESHCLTQRFRSFLNETESRIVYDAHVIKITEQSRLFVEIDILAKICASDARSLLEYVNFIKEACSRVSHE
jgi:hypothetical protein